jgi:F-box protein 11
MSFYDILDAVAEFKDKIITHLADPRQPLGNVIHANYAQGILVEEGCVADVYSNHISANLKANIALGG